jgi:predicted ATPase
MNEHERVAEIHRHLIERYPMYKTDNGFEQWLLEKTGADPARIDAYLDLLYGYGYIDGEGTLSGDYAAVPDPEHVQEDIRARLDRLDPASRTLLRTASIEGVNFDPEVTAALCGVPVAEALDAIRRGIDVGVVARAMPNSLYSGSGESYRFVPRQTREILYNELPDEDRVRLHAALLDFLGDRLQAADEPGTREMLEQMINEHNNIASRPGPLPSSEGRKP